MRCGIRIGGDLQLNLFLLDEQIHTLNQLCCIAQLLCDGLKLLRCVLRRVQLGVGQNLGFGFGLPHTMLESLVF